MKQHARKNAPRACLSLLAALALPVSCGYFDPLNPFDTTSVDTSVSWEVSIGGAGEDCARSVLQTADSGFALTGWTNSAGAGGFDLWFVRTDSSGTKLWERTYGGTGDDKGYCAAPTTDGGFVLAGSTTSFGLGEEDMYLVKIDVDGNEEWSRTYGGTLGDEARCVIQTADGGFVVAGITSSFGAGTADAYVVKTDDQGAVQWDETYGQIYEDRAQCIRQVADGGYVFAGLSEAGSLGDDNAWLVRTDADGSQKWSRTYGIEFLDSATWVEPAQDGGYALSGYTRSWGSGDFDAWLIKVDDLGVEQWSRTFGGAQYDRAEGILATPGGGFLLAGMTRSSGLWDQAWLIRVDSAGGLLWNKTFGGNGDEWGCSVQSTSRGGFIMAGSTTTGSGDMDAYLVYFKP